MTATARWADDQPGRPVGARDISELWAEVEAEASRPVILVIEAGGAEIGAVIGVAEGTVLTYVPAGYADTGIGSLHSVGDPVAAARDAWEPPVTGYYFGHHTEFPRWSLVPNGEGMRALIEFCDEPAVPPTAIAWEPD